MPKTNKEETMMEKAEEEIEGLKETYQEYKHSLVDYIKKNPMTAIALAAGAGALLGTCWKAMRCRK